MIEDNAALFIYLYGLYDNLGTLLELFLATYTSILLLMLIPTVGTHDEFIFDENDYKVRNKVTFTDKLIEVYKKPLTIFVIIVTVIAFIPSRNTVIMMVGAKPIIESAKAVVDSNRTTSLVNILDNSIEYLEVKSKELSNGNK